MIQYTTITLPAATLGNCNPLPDIYNNSYIHAGYQLTDAITNEESQNIGKGMLSSILPYMMQDGYTRDRKDTEFPAILLENAFLKAVFLPSLGGRLWQLLDKIHQKDLLYVNPVFQPCNLALRNAWFSGGVEFNVGIKGHTPLTCSPMFAIQQKNDDGQEILSMYEYERIRGVVYSINVWLPEDSPVLYIRNCIENTAPTDTQMYWWSNMAVPETPHTRVLVPTTDSFVCKYEENHYVLDKTTIPFMDDIDVSYPSNLHRSLDFFYKIPPESDKWIASVDKDGKGLLHFSESILKGRKLFLWGQGNGGRHWGEFLAGAQAHSGEGYIEIQAGLAHTQLEHFPMPGNSTIAFTECYAPICENANDLYSDWNTAVHTIQNCLCRYTGGISVDRYLKDRFPSLSSMTHQQILHYGSGWGHLENQVRKACGLAPISNIFTYWESPICKESGIWRHFLDTGCFPALSDTTMPISYMIDPPCTEAFWEKRLRAVTDADHTQSHTALQLGVTLYAAGKKKEAEKYWKIAARSENPYAWRNLAAYHANELHDYKKAIEEIFHTVELAPDNCYFAMDCASIVCATQDKETMSIFLQKYSTFSPAIQEHPRMRLWKARMLIATDQLTEAMEIITPDFVMPDIKEGELSISALWTELYTKYLMQTEGLSQKLAAEQVKIRYPLPYALDFRMHE